MSTYLNQIFYNHNKFDNASSIKRLEPFMYAIANKYVEEPVQPTIFVERPIVIRNEPANNDSAIWPDKSDTLFWSMFIAIYGYDEYVLINNHYGNKEIDEKQKIIEFIKTGPKILKTTNYKVTNVLIQEILSDLMVNNKTSLNTLISMVCFYKRRVYIASTKNTYLQFIPENTIEADPILIYMNDDGNYGIHDGVMPSLELRYLLEHYNKPLKAVSSYKTGELHEIAMKLRLSEAEYLGLNKPELYEMLSRKLAWPL
jgi:hypothetical protein